jgi:hypothetical protein
MILEYLFIKFFLIITIFANIIYRLFCKKSQYRAEMASAMSYNNLQAFHERLLAVTI